VRQTKFGKNRHANDRGRDNRVGSNNQQDRVLYDHLQQDRVGIAKLLRALQIGNTWHILELFLTYLPCDILLFQMSVFKTYMLKICEMHK